MKTLSPLIIDPALFSPEAISPETQKANDEIENALKAMPPIYEIGAEAVREARKNGIGLLALEPFSDIAQWRTIKANGLEVPIRVFTPETINGIYLHIHGGGHTLGSADNHDQMLEGLAKQLNIAVISVEYRLAPENPWPAQPDDCQAAATWLVDNMEKEFGTNRLTIGGESAGAHLSMVTMLRLRDHHGFTGFVGANLIYGIYDMTMTPSMENWGSRNLILSTPIVKWFGDNLLPPEKFSIAEKRAPDISPINAKLDGMPPALFTVGTLDPLIDDTLFMAGRWISTGLKTQLEIYPGGIHAFDALPIQIAKQAREKMANFLRDCIKN